MVNTYFPTLGRPPPRTPEDGIWQRDKVNGQIDT